MASHAAEGVMTARDIEYERKRAESLFDVYVLWYITTQGDQRTKDQYLRDAKHQAKKVARLTNMARMEIAG